MQGLKEKNQSLMNVDSGRLLSATLFNAKEGDIVHAKAKRITGFGRTMRVVRITPKRVKCKVVKLWFPVFKNTAFGRVAKGEDPGQLEWLKEMEQIQKGKVLEFRKDGTGWGNELRIVELID